MTLWVWVVFVCVCDDWTGQTDMSENKTKSKAKRYTKPERCAAARAAHALRAGPCYVG